MLRGKRRAAASAGDPVDDPDEPPAKKAKIDDALSEREEKVGERFPVRKLPGKTKHKRRKTSVSNAALLKESAAEADPTSYEPPSKKRRISVQYEERVELGFKREDVSGPQVPLNRDVVRCSTPAANSNEEGGAIAGKQNGVELSGDEFCQSGPSYVLPRKSPALGVEANKLPRRGKIVDNFPPLTEDMEREIFAAFAKGDADEVMSSAFEMNITRSDIHTLQNCCWLNDQIVDFYMYLLEERSKKEGYPAVHAFNAFFYLILISGGYQEVEQWTSNVDLFKKDIILVPLNVGEHWTLAVIDIRKKTIKYFDSSGGDGSDICETLFKYLQAECQAKRKLQLDCSEWMLHSMKSHEIPQQLNGSDCGVFTCKYAEYVTRDEPLTFTQGTMPYFRRRMVWEIIHQQLL